MTSLPTLVIADDHVPIRVGVKAMIEELGLADVIGIADRGDAALEMIRELQPDIALVDQRMPGLTGTELAAAVVQEGLATRVVVLSSYANVRVVRAAIKAGASGYIAKDSDEGSFSFVLSQVADGHMAVDPRLMGELLTSPADSDLSERQLEVLQRVAMGQMNDGIAADLGISAETVKTHLSAIMRKFDASTRTEVVAIALRQSIIE